MLSRHSTHQPSALRTCPSLSQSGRQSILDSQQALSSMLPSPCSSVLFSEHCFTRAFSIPNAGIRPLIPLILCNRDRIQDLHSEQPFKNIRAYLLDRPPPSLYIRTPLSANPIHHWFALKQPGIEVGSGVFRIVLRSENNQRACCIKCLLHHRVQHYILKRGGLQRIRAETVAPSALRYKLHHSQSSCYLTTLLSRMAEPSAKPEEAQKGKKKVENPLDRILGNDTCTLCKEHCFLIARFMKHHKELEDDFHADSRSKRKKLQKRKAEIEKLKERCHHLEEAVTYIKSITESMQAEASTKVSEKEPQMEDSVNQFW